MLNRKGIDSALLIAAAVSTSAMADNRSVNTALGAVARTVVGNVVGRQNGAVIGSVLGVVVGASVFDHDRRDRDYDGRRY